MNLKGAARAAENPACRGEVYRFIRRRGLGHEDAEDVAQDVVIRLWRGGFLSSDPRLIIATTRRVTASFLRRELAGKRDCRKRVVLDEHQPIDGRGHDRTCESREEVRRIYAAMRHIEESLATKAFRLRLEGHSYKEISRKIRRRVDVVTNYIHRERARLRAELEPSNRE